MAGASTTSNENENRNHDNMYLHLQLLVLSPHTHRTFTFLAGLMRNSSPWHTIRHCRPTMSSRVSRALRSYPATVGNNRPSPFTTTGQHW